MSWIAFELLMFGLAWVGVGFFRSYAVSQGMLDELTARSSHSVVTPRGAGIVFSFLWLGLVGVLTYYGKLNSLFLWIFMPAALITLVGFKDDCKSISPTIRLVVQAIATYFSLYYINLTTIDFIPWFDLPNWAALSLLAGGVLWMINLTNFMDGTDGFVGTQALFVFAIGGGLLYHSHAYSLATLAFGMSALLSGFLVWNWPTAKIFMGDSGSCFLGFIIAIFSLVSYKWFNIPLEIWIILTAGLWFDASITLIRRILARENPSEAHCSHAYQRLVQAGWSHAQVLTGSVLVNALMSVLACWAYTDRSLIPMIFGMAICLMSVVYLMVEIAKPMFGSWHEA